MLWMHGFRSRWSVTHGKICDSWEFSGPIGPVTHAARNINILCSFFQIEGKMLLLKDAFLSEELLIFSVRYPAFCQDFVVHLAYNTFEIVISAAFSKLETL